MLWSNVQLHVCSPELFITVINVGLSLLSWVPINGTMPPLQFRYPTLPQGLKTRRLSLPRYWARDPIGERGFRVSNSSIQLVFVKLSEAVELSRDFNAVYFIWYRIKPLINEVVIAENYDDTKNLKLFNRFFHLFDCSNQTRITSVIETRYFDSEKVSWSRCTASLEWPATWIPHLFFTSPIIMQITKHHLHHAPMFVTPGRSTLTLTHLIPFLSTLCLNYTRLSA